MKGFLKITAAVIRFMAALAVLLVVFLSATEYRPQLSQPADISHVITSEKLDINDTITVLS